MAIGSSTLFVLRALSRPKWLLLSLCASYIVLLALLGIQFVTSVKYWPVLVDDILNVYGGYRTVHALGIVATACSAFVFCWPRRTNIRYAIEALADKHLMSGNDNVAIFEEKEVQKRLVDFAKDATYLYIYAGGAGFLARSNKQHQEICEFGPKCKILLKPQASVEREDLHTLIRKGVNVRAYRPSFKDTGLRGRIKSTALSPEASLFLKRGKGFQIERIENTTVVQALIEQYEKEFEQGVHPQIRHVVFDLAGVFFDGDIKVFYQYLRQNFPGSAGRLNATADDYLCVDQELNKGGIGIVEVLESRLERKLAQEAADGVVKQWCSIWSPNEQMRTLASQLRKSGYTVSIASNCDCDNADSYDQQGWFNDFNHTFLSTQLKLTKPDPQFFLRILEKLDALPSECMFVDDHRINTKAARAAGFHTLLIDRTLTNDERVASIKQKLTNYRLVVEA